MDMLIDIDIPHQEEDQERDHVVIWMEIRRAAPLINKAGGEESCWISFIQY